MAWTSARDGATIVSNDRGWTVDAVPAHGVYRLKKWANGRENKGPKRRSAYAQTLRNLAAHGGRGASK